MSETSPLEALEALHRELVAVCEHRFETFHILEQELDAHAQAFQKLLDKPVRSETSRNAVKSGMWRVPCARGYEAWSTCQRRIIHDMLTKLAQQARSL